MSVESTESADLCICPPEGPCLGAEFDTGGTIECTACLVLDPEAQCLHDCDGSSECLSTLHIHGCYADLDGSACDDQGDHNQPERGVFGDPEIHRLLNTPSEQADPS